MLKLTEKNFCERGISIQHQLLNKYSSVDDIFIYEKDNIKINYLVKCRIKELENIELKRIKIKALKLLAYQIFCNNHSINVFINNGKEILVSRSGINESIEKVYYNRFQRELLSEHLKVFSCLGKIIEKAKLVNQAYENKGRIKYYSWNYYLDGIIINGKEFLVEFEVVSLDSGENHYRIQRLNFK